ncbi:MAG: hypothetical protein Q8L82_09225 [Nitrosomonas sp.]|nr:hypothetical protein [Nitrosomonas sp.]
MTEQTVAKRDLTGLFIFSLPLKYFCILHYPGNRVSMLWRREMSPHCQFYRGSLHPLKKVDRNLTLRRQSASSTK